MSDLLFSAEADEELTRLEADTGRTQLFERLDDVLDGVEDDPTDPKCRKRRYQTPPIWGVPVHGSGQDWLVLWSESDAGPFVHYIGPDLQ